MRRFLMPLALALTLAAMPGNAADTGATLVVTEGLVQARPLQKTQWQRAVRKQLFRSGDSVRTGKRSRAELAFADGTVTRLAAHSLLKVSDRQTGSFGRLMLGKLWFKITKQHAPIRIETPSAIAAVVGTELLVSVDGQEGTHVTCIEGHVKVQGNVGATVDLQAGQWTDIRKGQAAEPPTPFDWNKLKASETLLQPLQQDDGGPNREEDPDDIWKAV